MGDWVDWRSPGRIWHWLHSSGRREEGNHSNCDWSCNLHPISNPRVYFQRNYKWYRHFSFATYVWRLWFILGGRLRTNRRSVLIRYECCGGAKSTTFVFIIRYIFRISLFEIKVKKLSVYWCKTGTILQIWKLVYHVTPLKDHSLFLNCTQMVSM